MQVEYIRVEYSMYVCTVPALIDRGESLAKICQSAKDKKFSLHKDLFHYHAGLHSTSPLVEYIDVYAEYIGTPPSLPYSKCSASIPGDRVPASRYVHTVYTHICGNY